MTVYIDKTITEVIPVAEQNETSESDDSRWLEKQKAEAMIARMNRINCRTLAEGMHD